MQDQTSTKPAGGLAGVSDTLLRNPNMANSWLKQADVYMQAYVEDPTSFLLPREHAFLKPLIEAYAHDLEGFTRYVMGVRDSVEKGSGAWERLQTLYRRLGGRLTQQLRRERSDRAIAKAEELYGKADFHTRLKWVSDLEHSWAQRRLDFLADARARTENDRLSSDDRAEVLAEFWCIIDTEIYNGEVPPWN